MRNFLIKSALSLTLGLTGLPLLAGGASAQDFELSIGRGGPQLRVQEPCDANFDTCYASRHYVYQPDEYQPVVRGCTEGRALNKAERMGIYRPRIASEGRRTIEVRGRTPDGDRAYITFSRQPGCPVLDY